MVLQYITTIICLVATISLIVLIMFERKHKPNNINKDEVNFEDFYVDDIDENYDGSSETNNELTPNLDRTFSDFDLFKKPITVDMFEDDDDEDDEFNDYEDIQINVVDKSK